MISCFIRPFVLCLSFEKDRPYKSCLRSRSIQNTSLKLNIAKLSHFYSERDTFFIICRSDIDWIVWKRLNNIWKKFQFLSRSQQKYMESTSKLQQYRHLTVIWFIYCKINNFVMEYFSFFTPFKIWPSRFTDFTGQRSSYFARNIESDCMVDHRHLQSDMQVLRGEIWDSLTLLYYCCYIS